jgi:hypothetical protein
MFPVLFYFLSSIWIVIGFGLDCQSILKSGFIWIFNHIFVLDLDWIDNPKNWIEQKPARDITISLQYNSGK